MAEKTYIVDVDGLKITGSAEKIDELASVYKFASIGYENELRSLMDTADNASRDVLQAEIEKVHSKYDWVQKQLKNAICDSDYSKQMAQAMSELTKKMEETNEDNAKEAEEQLFIYIFHCENAETGFISNDCEILAHNREEAEVKFWECNPDCGVDENDELFLTDTNDSDAMVELAKDVRVFYHSCLAIYDDEDGSLIEKESDIGVDYITPKQYENLSGMNEFYDNEQGSISSVEYFRTREEAVAAAGYGKENVKDLWDEFGDIPINDNTDCIEAEWLGFEAGTPREEIWHWFEDTFDVSVAEDLMYTGEEDKDL